MRKIILFGTGKYGLEALDYFGSDNVAFFADNNVNIQGSFISGIEVIAPSRLNGYADNAIIVLAAGYSICTQMEYQLKSMGIEKYVVYRYLREQLAPEGNKTSKDFINEFQTDAGIYRLMYLYADNLHKCSEERIEFFMHTADVRGVKPAGGKLRIRQTELLDATLKVKNLAESIGIHLMLGEGNLIGAVRNGGFVPWDDDMDLLLMRDDYKRLIDYCNLNGMLYVSSSLEMNQNDNYRETVRKMYDENKEILFTLNGSFLAAYVKSSNGSSYPYIVDIFPLDYYNESCTYDDLRKYVNECSVYCRKSMMSFKERIEYNDRIAHDGGFVSEVPTGRIGYGIETFFVVSACSGFCRADAVLPVTGISFEGHDFAAPSKPEEFLKMEYGDIYRWPSDAGQTAHGTGRHYIQYRHFENPVYIACLQDMSDIHDRTGNTIIVEKYKIKDIAEYFAIIDKLEEEESNYYVYS